MHIEENMFAQSKLPATNTSACTDGSVSYRTVHSPLARFVVPQVLLVVRQPHCIVDVCVAAVQVALYQRQLLLQTLLLEPQERHIQVLNGQIMGGQHTILTQCKNVATLAGTVHSV